MKNLIICGLLDQQVKYLSPTREGKKHDKKIADEESIQVPAGSDLYQDTGFQGFSISGVKSHQPKKKQKGENLTTGDKIINHLISKTRVGVEHVIAGIKRLHIVKAVFRNIQDNHEDDVIDITRNNKLLFKMTIQFPIRFLSAKAMKNQQRNVVIFFGDQPSY